MHLPLRDKRFLLGGGFFKVHRTSEIMKFKKGNKVEVLKRNDGQHSSWFPAKILSVYRGKCAVRYDLYRTSDGKIVEETETTVDLVDVRPCPPPSVHVKEQWTDGDTAEVLNFHSWKLEKVQQARQKNQAYAAMRSKHANVADQAAYEGLREEVRDAQRPADAPFSCISPAKAMKIKAVSPCGFFSGQEVRVTNKRRKASSREDEFLQKSSRALPKEPCGSYFLENTASQNRMHRMNKQESARYHQLGADNNNVNDSAFNCFRMPEQAAEEDIECSVASCSSKELPPCHAHKTIRKLSKDTSSNLMDDAMSSSPPESGKGDRIAAGDKLAASIHDLELYAYRSTIQALHASGPLSWDQESLLTNLRLSLNISNEEHLLHLRHLLSA